MHARNHDFPMPSYIAAWKLFRSFSNEDELIARALVESINARFPHAAGPTGTGLSLFDVGPGDGRVLFETLIKLETRPARVEFAEPDRDFFKEVEKNIGYYDFADQLVKHHKKLNDVEPEAVSRADVVICTHAIYFLTDRELNLLIGGLRPSSLLLILMDDPTSIFSTLWAHTNPRFHQVAEGHRRTLEGLASGDNCAISVRTTTVKTDVVHPGLVRTDLASMLKSFMSYTEYDDLTIEECAVVDRLIDQARVEGHVPCRSKLYELTVT